MNFLNLNALKMKRNKSIWIIVVVVVILWLVFSSNTTAPEKYQEFAFYPNNVAVKCVNEKISNGYRVLSVTSSDKPTYEGIYVSFEK